jgi:SAM-dependent methyltransferase
MKRKNSNVEHHECPSCNSADSRIFFEANAQPVLIGVQWPDAESARASKTGDVRLAFCRRCGFIWNVLFDPARLEYQQTYENSLHFSKVFQDYTQAVVDRLVTTYGVYGKRVVDIGCGKGDFLAMLCEAGDNYGFGFDPTYEGVRIETSARDRIRWLRENYTEQHAALQADLITSRYVFEHIPSPLPFLEMIRRSIAEPASTVIYFEVPNTDLILRQHSVWDVIYEHCTYFSVESLPRVFERAGFEVLRVDEHYGKQFVSVDARVRTNLAARNGAWGDLAALHTAVDAFERVVPAKLQAWREKLAAWKAEGKRVVIWGGGAKAVGFLNMLNVGAEVATVVDINPHKRDKYLSGTGHRVVSPEYLTGDPPDVVVLMNPIYRDEVAKQLAAMNLHPQLTDA